MQKIFHTYRFCFNELHSPTFINLKKYLQEQGWKPTRFNWLADFNDKNLQFNVSASEHLEFKHLLAKLVNQNCPKIMPETYCIDDHNWATVLTEIADKYYMNGNNLLDKVDNLIWILKPSMLNNGQHIKIFQHLSEIEQHYISSNRLGGAHVLQKYIHQPHLLNGHKYSIRMFVVMTNYAGAFLYPTGYFNVALQPYQAMRFENLKSHLTNEHLSDEESNVEQIPTTQFNFFKDYYSPIKNIITQTLTGLKRIFPEAFICKKKKELAIVGFDFLIDSAMRVWLLEANHGPCFPTTDAHPLQKKLYYNFWQAIITEFIVPIAKKKPFTTTSSQLFTPLTLVLHTTAIYSSIINH